MTDKQKRAQKDISGAFAAVWVVILIANAWVLWHRAAEGESLTLSVLGTAISAGFIVFNILRYRRA